MSMNFRKQMAAAFAAIIASAYAGAGDIQLMEPMMENPGTLMEALQGRSSCRSFLPDTLSTREMSDLLWAAFGINRPETGGRTAPSALNHQEMDIYVATAEGTYLYDPAANTLRMTGSTDIRALTGMQPFVAEAPVNLVLVADFSRMGFRGREVGDDERLFFAACDAGFICQNVYLYCAVNGLAAVVRAGMDKAALREALGLRPEQHLILAQTIGRPAPL